MAMVLYLGLCFAAVGRPSKDVGACALRQLIFVSGPCSVSVGGPRASTDRTSLKVRPKSEV